ncbi:MAG: exodeoxyribonuclease VII large subunit [Deltaproteobacteria bacterium]|nr:exodeoxyribonuclease VII large subunit [Deltaproteobacteria bacterium]
MHILKQLINRSSNKLYTVSELNTGIKKLLEEKFPLIWICGEISNFKIPSSNHYYFTLKDNNSQISAVIFANQNRHLKFAPENGMKIKGVGRISLYEPRGVYQVIFEHIEPYGLGELQAAFEQLKSKLEKEGLFDRSFKKPIPLLPKKISVVSSPTGAVIHDIQTVIKRRYPNIHIEIAPVKVQGENSEQEISESIDLLSRLNNTDLIILARGGGSLEDLAAFNTEIVARSIFACKIPIISAIGHQTDFTIADFTADLRAPTPSAAAEIAVSVKTELEHKIFLLYKKAYSLILNGLEKEKNRSDRLYTRIINPKKKIDDLRLKTDDLRLRMSIVIRNKLQIYNERLKWKISGLNIKELEQRIYEFKLKLYALNNNLLINLNINHNKQRFEKAFLQIKNLNPEHILKLGYGIIEKPEDNKLIKSIKDITTGDNLEIRVSDGFIECSVTNLKKG